MNPPQLKHLFTVWLLFVVNPGLIAEFDALSAIQIAAYEKQMGLAAGGLTSLVGQVKNNASTGDLAKAAGNFAGFAHASGYPPTGGPVCGHLVEVINAQYPPA